MHMMIVPPDLIQVDGEIRSLDKMDFPTAPATYEHAGLDIDYIVWRSEGLPDGPAPGVIWVRQGNKREARYFHERAILDPYLWAFTVHGREVGQEDERRAG